MSFLSTPSARRATSPWRQRAYRCPISIHALREEGDLTAEDALGELAISIHALREEGDSSHLGSCIVCPYFYPRPPRGGRQGFKKTQNHTPDFYPRPPRGGRLGGGQFYATTDQFLSTPSARRATRGLSAGHSDDLNFYPRPPRGGRPLCCLYCQQGKKFLSTPSARRATVLPSPARGEVEISIHALREEGDPQCGPRTAAWGYFYPRPPRGGRQTFCTSGTTAGPISIHALREEGDFTAQGAAWSGRNFYPRPPRGGRPRSAGKTAGFRPDFYPRPPRGGRRNHGDDAAALRDFYPRPPRGGRPQWPWEASFSIC